ncbi:hypothetical protein C8F01DRAFT_1082539 [Mycena amicta]|nr:hypothetical protein C8F01DRAFT_1082539 [Mycena amicta]
MLLQSGFLVSAVALLSSALRTYRRFLIHSGRRRRDPENKIPRGVYTHSRFERDLQCTLFNDSAGAKPAPTSANGSTGGNWNPTPASKRDPPTNLNARLRAHMLQLGLPSFSAFLPSIKRETLSVKKNKKWRIVKGYPTPGSNGTCFNYRYFRFTEVTGARCKCKWAYSFRGGCWLRHLIRQRESERKTKFFSSKPNSRVETPAAHEYRGSEIEVCVPGKEVVNEGRNESHSDLNACTRIATQVAAENIESRASFCARCISTRRGEEHKKKKLLSGGIPGIPDSRVETGSAEIFELRRRIDAEAQKVQSGLVEQTGWTRKANELGKVLPRSDQSRPQSARRISTRRGDWEQHRKKEFREVCFGEYPTPASKREPAETIALVRMIEAGVQKVQSGLVEGSVLTRKGNKFRSVVGCTTNIRKNQKPHSQEGSHVEYMAALVKYAAPCCGMEQVRQAIQCYISETQATHARLRLVLDHQLLAVPMQAVDSHRKHHSMTESDTKADISFPTPN